MGSYHLQALLLVLAIPIASVAAVALAIAWARDALRHSVAIGAVGIALAGMAFMHLVLARDLGPELNRPAVAAFTGSDDARRAGVAGFDVLVLTGVATTLAARRQAEASAR